MELHETAGTIVPGDVNTFLIQGSHTYAEEGSFTITSHLSGNGITATAISPAVITDAPLIAQSGGIVTLQGQAFSGLVASFTDTDPNGTLTDYSATINWGDGTTTAGTIVQGTEVFLVDGTHTYAQSGTDPILITITDTGGASVSFNTMATVDTFSTNPLTFSGIEGALASQNLATLITNDTNAASLSVSIDWGDGTPQTAGTIVPGDVNTFLIQGSHTYAEEGSFTITSHLSGNGITATVTSPAVITDAPLTAQSGGIVTLQGQSFSGLVEALQTQIQMELLQTIARLSIGVMVRPQQERLFAVPKFSLLMAHTAMPKAELIQS